MVVFCLGGSVHAAANTDDDSQTKLVLLLSLKTNKDPFFTSKVSNKNHKLWTIGSRNKLYKCPLPWLFFYFTPESDFIWPHSIWHFVTFFASSCVTSQLKDSISTFSCVSSLPAASLSESNQCQNLIIPGQKQVAGIDLADVITSLSQRTVSLDSWVSQAS